MAFYMNEFKAHLEQLSKDVQVTDHTEPRQFNRERKRSLEESYKSMRESQKPEGFLRETRTY